MRGGGEEVGCYGLVLLGGEKGVGLEVDWWDGDWGRGQGVLLRDRRIRRLDSHMWLRGCICRRHRG